MQPAATESGNKDRPSKNPALSVPVNLGGGSERNGDADNFPGSDSVDIEVTGASVLDPVMVALWK